MTCLRAAPLSSVCRHALANPQLRYMREDADVRTAGGSPVFATLGCGIGSAQAVRLTRSRVSYRLSCSPAVAEIVGDGRPWTVLMISLLSMPCR